MFYNFVRIHQGLRATPAIAAGVTNKLCEIADTVKLLEWYTEDRKKEGRENPGKAIEQSYNPFGQH